MTLKIPPAQSLQGTPQDPKIGIPASSIQHRNGHQQGRRGIILTWKWEIFTWLLGTCAFVAIIILLFTFDDQPLQRWKSTVQITTTVATLSQIAQSALLVPVSYCISQLKWEWFRCSQRSIDIDRFDLASRGPDGSARLLYHLAWKPRLVSLGALATVLLLTFSSFVQQAVRINTKELKFDQSTKAQIPQITILPGTVDDANTDLYSISPRPLDLQMSTAIKSGLLASSISLSDVAGHCDAGRCTWGPYQTLGLCSETEDISASILPNTDDPNIGEVSSGSPPVIPAWNPDKVAPPSIPDLGPMFPSGMPYENAFMSKSSGVNMFPSKFFDNDDYQLTSNNSKSNLPDLAQIYFLYYDPCEKTDHEDMNYNLYGWKAFKGRLRMCIQTLKSDYNGTTRTEVIASEADITWEVASGISDWPIWCARPQGATDKFCFDSSRANLLPVQVNSVFNATMSIVGEKILHWVAYSTDWGQVLTEAVIGKRVLECNREPGLGFDGFTRIVTNVGNSLSNTMRTGNGSTVVNGTTWTSEQFIEVDFWWMSMPIALYVTITFFFLSTAIKTRNAPPWKSSPLPLLSCTHPDNNLGSTKEIERDAMHTSIQLNVTATGWHMVDTTVNRKQRGSTRSSSERSRMLDLERS